MYTIFTLSCFVVFDMAVITSNTPVFWDVTSCALVGTGQLKCDGTRKKKISAFARNGRVLLNRPWWASVQSTTGSRGVRISGSNAGYTVFRGSVKSTGYPLRSPVSPSLPLLCVTVCHHISTAVCRPVMGLFYLF